MSVLESNIEKIKELLTEPDYDKIQNGINLAVSFNEPRIFEILLDGCTISHTIEGGYEHCGSGGGHRPVLNHWLSKLQIQNHPFPESKLIRKPTSQTGVKRLLKLIQDASFGFYFH